MFATLDTATLQQYARDLSQRTSFSVDITARTHSTNQVLLDEAASLDERPTVLLALAQSAGRGRRGRAWHSGADSVTQADTGDAFLGSLGLVHHGALTMLGLLPLHVGVAVARCVRGWGVAAQVKWPNDIWVGDAKLAGILVETKPVASGAALGQSNTKHGVVIGLGLNWTAAPQLDGRITACIADYLDTLPAPTDGAYDLIAAMNRAYGACTQGAELDFAAYDALCGKRIVTADGTLQGTAIGINAAGHLGLSNAQGTHWLHSGEVSVMVLP